MQSFFADAVVLFYTGTVSKWLREQVVSRNGYLVRYQYCDALAAGTVRELQVCTLCANGLEIDEQRIGELEALGPAECARLLQARREH